MLTANLQITELTAKGKLKKSLAAEVIYHRVTLYLCKSEIQPFSDSNMPFPYR